MLVVAPGASLPWGGWDIGPSRLQGQGFAAAAVPGSQPWSAERPCCCGHQVPDRRQEQGRDLGLSGILPPAPPSLLLEDETQQGASMEK